MRYKRRRNMFDILHLIDNHMLIKLYFYSLIKNVLLPQSSYSWPQTLPYYVNSCERNSIVSSTKFNKPLYDFMK